MTWLDRLEPVRRETTPSRIAERVRERIMDGSAPPGSQIGEALLASRLQVSRGPVREALQRLIQEGLLYSEPNRGVFVVRLEDLDIPDIYLARRAIEGAAAVTLARRRDPEALVELEDALGEMAARVERDNWDQVADMDLRFHEVLVTASGSRRLSRMFRTLLVETKMCMTALELAYPQRRRGQLVAEHGALLDAIRDGDEQRALRLIDDHHDQAIAYLDGSD